MPQVIYRGQPIETADTQTPSIKTSPDSQAPYPDGTAPDGSGGYPGLPPGGAGPLSGPAPTPAARSANDLAGLNSQYGFNVDASDVQSYLNGVGSVSDYDARMKARAASSNSRTVDSQSAAGNALYGSGTGNTANVPGAAYGPSTGGAATAAPSYPKFANTSPTFDDPASRLLEDYALDRFKMRQNPDPNSGTAMYEQYAKQLIDTLKGPVYSAGDESIIKGRANDAITTEEAQTQRQWLDELARRNIQPSSGVALDGLLKIKNHYAGLRTQVDSQFAQNAIDQTRQQRTQVLDTYGQLANSEESRMREALTYATLPYEMQNNSFQRNLQLVGAGGSPSSLLQSALSMFNAGNAANAQQSQQRQQALSGIMQYIGYMFPSMSEEERRRMMGA